MAQINQQAFAARIREYINNPACFEQEFFDSSLHTVTVRVQPTSPQVEKGCLLDLQGLCFEEYIELVMILLKHSYHSLQKPARLTTYCAAMAQAVQSFAKPLAVNDPASYMEPHFLLHGLEKATIAESVAQCVDNGRIIHETLDVRARYMAQYGCRTLLGNGLQMMMEDGFAEDNLGICCFISKEDEPNPNGGGNGYAAKVSFFLDTSQMEITIITIQGQQVNKAVKNRSRDYARLGARLKIDPRGYLLKKVCEVAKLAGYKRVRVIRPEFHPLTIDQHGGFVARYDNLIRELGITYENDCYLEGSL
ncbi:MAG: hypothetical protein PHI97_14540 [Desulfobulbus sp.]|nr:hypothetical protein [Desulfobulbus sp.]